MNRQPRLILSLLALLFAGSLPAQGPPPGGNPPPLPPVRTPLGNPITAAKANLGKVLFWDEQLSTTNTVACATCHVPGAAGTDPRVGVHPGPDGLFGSPDDKRASPGVMRADGQNKFMRDPVFGHNVQVTTRSAPTMINAAYAQELFWDGRATDDFRDPVTGALLLPTNAALESQAAGPPLSDSEMAHDNRDWNAVSDKLRDAKPLRLASNLPAALQSHLAVNPTYPDLFAAAFGTQDITPARIAMAIATYQRTLISNQTPYDRFLAGVRNALTPNQMRGLQVFRTNGRCSVCHTEPRLASDTFRNIGLRPVAEDAGRFEITGNNIDRGRFKVPSLRNVGLKSTFMHNGQFNSLMQVIDFYARRGDFADNRDPVMQQINLPPQDRQALDDFLRNALLDPRVAAETIPFDRPTLHSETPAATVPVVAPGSVASNGRAPRMLNESPSNVGNIDFKVGLGDVRAGELAFLAVSSVAAPPGTVVGGLPVGVGFTSPDFLLLPVPLSGVGVNGGYSTLQAPLPDDPALVGLPLYLQWLVTDSGSALGAAVSPAVGLTLF